MIRASVLTALTLAACSAPAPAPDNAAATPANVADAPPPLPAPTSAGEDRYLGRWRGVEGMYLNVSRAPQGGLDLEMQYDLDHKGAFHGEVTPQGIAFTRDGKAEVLRPSDGAATGLKWLDGKTDCLTVRSGEGYCRV